MSVMQCTLVCKVEFRACCVGKLEGAMKDMVATVAKSLDKAQQNLAARVANTFAILWYVLTLFCDISDFRLLL